MGDRNTDLSSLSMEAWHAENDEGVSPWHVDWDGHQDAWRDGFERGHMAAQANLRHVGWMGPYGIVPGGLDNEPAPHWKPLYIEMHSRPAGKRDDA